MPRRFKFIPLAAAFVALSFTAACATSPTSTQRVDHRQDVQQARIAHGVATGSLTWAEAERLEKQQRQIAKMERKALQDGWLSPKERAKIDHAQDRADRTIYREKHDRQERYYWK